MAGMAGRENNGNDMKKHFIVISLFLVLCGISQATTLSDIRSQVRYDIRDTTDTVNIDVRFSDTILNQRINIVQDYVVRYTKCLYTRNISTPVAGQQEYLLPSDCSAIDRVRFTGSAQRLVGRTLAGLDNEIPSWESTSAGIPRYYYRRGNNIGLYPAPSVTLATSGALKIDYFQKATAMTSDSDTIFNGDASLADYANVIIEGVDIMCLQTMNEDTTKLENRYKFDLDSMKEWCLFRRSNDINENIQVNR